MATFYDTSYFSQYVNSSGSGKSYTTYPLTAANNNTTILTRWTPNTNATYGDPLSVTVKWRTTSTDFPSSGTYRWYIRAQLTYQSGQVYYKDSTAYTTAATRTTKLTFSSSQIRVGEKHSLQVTMVRQLKSMNGWLNQSPSVTRKINFYTNRRPAPPVITTPVNNTSIPYADGAASRLTARWTAAGDPDSTSSPLSPELNEDAFATDTAGWEVQLRQAVGNEWTEWKRPRGYIVNNTRTVVAADLWILPGDDFLPPYSFSNPSPNNYSYGGRARGLMLIAEPGVPNYYSFNGVYGAIMLAPGTYQYRVRIFDNSAYQKTPTTAGVNSTSDWSSIQTIYVTAPFLAPVPISPINDVAVSGDTITFKWRFRDPRDSGGTQNQRQIRVRPATSDNEADWVLLLSAGTVPTPSGPEMDTDSQVAVVPAASPRMTYVPGIRYEWQAATRSSPGNHVSNWGDSGFFYFVDAPGSGEVLPDAGVTFPDAGLGCGNNRAFLYQRGGKVPLGEITSMSSITWERVRDDISQANLAVSLDEESLSPECEQLLTNVRSWLHEIVIFRDSGNGPQRVWEGPVTRVAWKTDSVEIAAHDVMVWPYRRILRQGYSDAYRVVGRTYKTDGSINNPGTTLSSPRAVTLRSASIIQNSLAYDDPNVLPYLTVLDQEDDAKQSRSAAAYSRSAWQDVDDFAAKSGLDYTTVGRKIILWDTHNAIGTLPEMRDGDFDTTLVVTEYGMQAANVYGVTNGSGIYGLADRLSVEGADEYGHIEMLVTAWGEGEEGGADVTLTQEQIDKLTETMEGQAERGIEARWPPPLIVRVPDNSKLNPDLAITINQLIPGVHVPLRSTGTLREVAQMQKLDNVKVRQDAQGGETVSITLSPAPDSRESDPDSGEGGSEGGE